MRTRPLYEETPDTRIAGARRDIRQLKRRLYRPGPWQYATPLSPAPDPSDIADSVEGNPFQNGWQNIALPDGSWSPLRWRFSHDGRVQLTGSIDGGALGSVCVTLPSAYRPLADVVTTISSTDGSRVLTVQISASSGDVTVVGIPEASPVLSDGQVTTTTIADGAVTTAKLADGAVTGAKLEDDGVTAGTYGDATHVAQITVDSKGRVTDATDVAITGGGGGGITDLASPGGTLDITNPTGPTTDIDLPPSGVTAGTYGDASDVAQITVDAEGRVTDVATVPIAGGGSVVASDGWVPDAAETWTFASFTAGPPAVGTFTVAGDVRAKYPVGTKIKLTQTTVKFFVVSADATFDGTNTTVTITGGTDYTLANAAISANYHSYVSNPQGWPGWFNFAPGPSGWSGTPTVNVARFAVNGRVCHLNMDITGTSNATSASVIAPIPNPSPTLGQLSINEDNSTIATTPGRISIGGAGSSTVAFARNMAGGAWTASGTKRVAGVLVYEI